jgi:hypothetical protein
MSSEVKTLSSSPPRLHTPPLRPPLPGPAPPHRVPGELITDMVGIRVGTTLAGPSAENGTNPPLLYYPVNRPLG